MLCGSHLGLRHLGKGLLGGDCDFCAKNYVSSDTLENEVIEKEVVKVKTDTEKCMYCNETIHHYLNVFLHRF